MNRVVVGSAFRNSTRYLARYFQQLKQYRTALQQGGWDLRLIAAEGDSTDGTLIKLLSYAKELKLDVEFPPCSHGGPVFGSTEDPVRFRAMSKVGNAIFSAVRPSDDVLVYVESDLVWEPTTLLRLGGQVVNGLDVVAPMVFAGKNFYDVWGFRGLDSTRFAPFAPYHSQLRRGKVNEVSSVGSCLVMKAEVARSCRMINDECLVGFCRDARVQGYQIWVDTRERVHQP